ncbi:unnamed protein product [Ostreobium quekettii]|uniref:Uncharacterized protein n=1 Tax=Ostreobium quekettii TaxID=121088 RepID=A0A8S1JC26_9CHLO|nr:unnamed protein product [Ostreobium quekettii]
MGLARAVGFSVAAAEVGNAGSALGACGGAGLGAWGRGAMAVGRTGRGVTGEGAVGRMGACGRWASCLGCSWLRGYGTERWVCGGGVGMDADIASAWRRVATAACDASPALAGARPARPCALLGPRHGSCRPAAACRAGVGNDDWQFAGGGRGSHCVGGLKGGVPRRDPARQWRSGLAGVAGGIAGVWSILHRRGHLSMLRQTREM